MNFLKRLSSYAERFKFPLTKVGGFALYVRIDTPMELHYVCSNCQSIVILHKGDLSRIVFGKLPNKLLEAETKHHCISKRKAVA